MPAHPILAIGFGALGGKGEEEGDELIRRDGRRCAGPRVPARLRPGHGRRSLLRPMEAPPGCGPFLLSLLGFPLTRSPRPGCRRRDLGARRRPYRGGVRLPPGQGLPKARGIVSLSEKNRLLCVSICLFSSRNVLLHSRSEIFAAVSCVRVHGGGAAPVWAEFGPVRRLSQHIFYPWTCPCDRNPVPWP